MQDYLDAYFPRVRELWQAVTGEELLILQAGSKEAPGALIDAAGVKPSAVAEVQGDGQIWLIARLESAVPPLYLASRASEQASKETLSRFTALFEGLTKQFNNRRLEDELSIASQIQNSLTPGSLPEIPGLQFAALLRPASRFGGDFYDLLEIPGGVIILIGDVAGKGIPAAMLTALVHATLKSEAQHEDRPAVLLQAINRLTYPELDRAGTFITAFLAVIQNRPPTLQYASAGHTSALFWQAGEQDVLTLSSTGLPLGISQHLEIQQRHIPFSIGDVLVLYSDGITEAENEQGRIFGSQALIDLLLSVYPASADQQMNIILEAQRQHRGEMPLRDDVTLFITRAVDAAQESPRIIPFVFPAEKRNVSALAILARRAASQLPFNSDQEQSVFLNELELAVSEIATNVVMHAYQDSRFPGRLQGRVTLLPDRFRLDLVDSGLTFLPPSFDEPLNYPLVDPPSSGYGLAIAKRLLDVCEYKQIGSGRNHWQLEKILKSDRWVGIQTRFSP